MIYSTGVCRTCGTNFSIHDHDFNTPAEEMCPGCLEKWNKNLQEPGE